MMTSRLCLFNMSVGLIVKLSMLSNRSSGLKKRRDLSTAFDRAAEVFFNIGRCMDRGLRDARDRRARSGARSERTHK